MTLGNPFAGRVAVVTGAGQGIGAAVAKRLSGAGASVVLLDLNREAVDTVAEEIRQSGGVALALRCDVANAREVDAAIAVVGAEFGRIDVLVNNAGTNRDALLFRMTEDDWDTVLDSHLKGGFLCARSAQRLMVENRYGKIVFVSSRAALGNRGQANYSAAKAGMQGLTKTLAIELGPFNINVNAVAPGHVDTPMTRAVSNRTGVPYDNLRDKAIEVNAIKRVGTPEDIAAAVAFLASDEASYITGQVLYVTGRPVN
jgi:3-oxoacyl-[acyl-carrier protein] reductase